MKATVLTSWLAVLLGASAAASAAGSCEFNIVGTWEASSPDGKSVITARYRFAPDGTVATLSRIGSPENPQWEEPAPTDYFLYRLDNPKAPAAIELLANDGVTLRGKLEIVQYDQDTFATVDEDNGGTTRWTKVEPQKYFMVLSARSGPPPAGGPAFAMLIKTDRGLAQTDAFGYYLVENERIVGRIPQTLANKLATEVRSNSEAMLRLELTQAEFERSLRVLRTWERRERERAMLYPVPHLNNIVFLNEIVKSLNTCSDRVKQYNLTWKIDDKVVADQKDMPNIGFRYVRELRELNRSLHVTDEQFRKRTGIKCLSGCSGSTATVAENAAPRGVSVP